MQADEFINYSISGEKSLTQENLSQIELVRSEPDATKPDVAAIVSSDLVLLPVSIIAFFGLLFFVSTDVWAWGRHRVQTLKKSRGVPCENCQYFSNNPYLRCAVHPSTALTAEAIGCSDYRPQNVPRDSNESTGDKQEKQEKQTNLEK